MTGANPLTAQEQIGLAGTIKISSAQGAGGGDRGAPTTRPTPSSDLVLRINHRERRGHRSAHPRGQARAARHDRREQGRPRLRPAPRRGLRPGSSWATRASSAPAPAPRAPTTGARADATRSLRAEGADLRRSRPSPTPAGWLAVAPEIKSDIGSIAAGFGENGRPAQAGDGSTALAIAALRSQGVMVGNLRSFDDHFAEAVARVGPRGRAGAELGGDPRARETHGDRQELRDLRSSMSAA